MLIVIVKESQIG